MDSKKLNADDVLKFTYSNHKKDIDDVMAGIKEESGKLIHPKGISDAGMKLASIPGDVYDAFCHSHGRFCWQDPQFVQWFLKKYPHFKYVPSVSWTTSRF